jgi:hypothetical protein
MMTSGHKTRSVFDRYNIVDERDLKNGARLPGEYVARKSQPASNLDNWHTSGTQKWGEPLSRNSS